MPETILYLKYDGKKACSDVIVSVSYREVSKIDSCLFKIVFYKARGGQTLLFGKVISDKSAKKGNTVQIRQEDVLIQELNYNQIMELPSITMDSLTIYKVN